MDPKLLSWKFELLYIYKNKTEMKENKSKIVQRKENKFVNKNV